MASMKQAEGKKALVEVLLEKGVIEELRKRGVETLGLADEGIIYKVDKYPHFDGNCLAISVTAKSKDYDGDRAVASYKERIKYKIEALKSKLAFYEGLGL